MEAGLWWWARRRSAVFDGVLALASALEAAAEMPSFGSRFGIPVWASAILGFLLGAMLLFRRKWPVALVLLSAATSPTESGYLLALIALYSLGAYHDDRRSVLGVGGIALAAAVVTTYVLNPPRMQHGPTALRTWEFALVVGLTSVAVVAVPLLLGLYAGARRRLVTGLRERARRLELEQTLLAERARGEERARIAREMHDVVAHRVSLMVVHAGAIRAVARKAPDKAEQSAELVGEIGRQALDELRQVLGVLRSRGDGEARPVLADVEGLVVQSRSAGMDVGLEVAGEPQRFPGELEGTAYRLVQEGLTNAHKHASGAVVRVRVAYAEDAVEVEIANGRAPGGGGGAALPSGGNGLRGMRERVEGLGGTFSAGAEGDGFAVRARLRR